LLCALGVRKVFGNPGSTEMPFLADIPDDIDYVLGLHEGAVVGMADLYAQLTGEPTLVNLHTAVGLGNAMGAIINAASGHSPLVITAGQQVRATLTMQPLLANTDPIMLPRPAVKWAFEPPRAQDVPAALARAFRYAALPPAGPVFVSLPMDDFEQPAEAGTTERLAARRLTGRSVPAPVDLHALAKRLTAAHNPVLVVGAGMDAAPDGLEAGVALAERQNLPVWLAPNTSRVGFPTDHAHFRGSLPAGIAWLSESLAGHDLILVAGAPVFQYYPYAPGSYLPPGAELVAIVDDPDAAARAPIGDALIADPALAVRGLLELLPQTNRPAPALHAPLEVPPAVDTLTASQVYDILGPLFGHNGIVVTESMNGAAAMWDRMKFRRSGSFFFCAAGGLGFAVPGAVGAQLAHPERPVGGQRRRQCSVRHPRFVHRGQPPTSGHLPDPGQPRIRNPQRLRRLPHHHRCAWPRPRLPRLRVAGQGLWHPRGANRAPRRTGHCAETSVHGGQRAAHDHRRYRPGVPLGG
jgi:benzoylformate decarboxylase